MVKIKMLVQRQEADEKGQAVIYQKGKTYEVDKHFAQRYVDAQYAAWEGGSTMSRSFKSPRKRGRRG